MREFIFIALFIAVCGLFVTFEWYTASKQADVYRRSGVEMSTWEVFIGCKPITREVIIK